MAHRMTGTVAAAVRHGLRFIDRAQLPDGEIPTVVVARDDRGGDCGRGAPDSNFFTASLVLASLLRARSRGARVPNRVVGRTCNFVRGGRLPNGTWRFWTRKTVRLVDPDTDVTACALAAIRETGDGSPELDIDVLRRARRADGLFVTWFREREPNDVDAVVNANVAWALREQTPREVCVWLGEVIANCSERTSMHYYDDPVVLHRAVVRAHRAGASHLGPFVAKLRERLESGTGSPDALTLALRLAALSEMDAALPDQLVDELLAAQRADGSWPWCPAWSGPEPPRSRDLYWGSEALTTAVAIEALSSAYRRY